MISKLIYFNWPKYKQTQRRIFINILIMFKRKIKRHQNGAMCQNSSIILAARRQKGRQRWRNANMHRGNKRRVRGKAQVPKKTETKTGKDICICPQNEEE